MNEALKVFLSVVEYGNFTRAAESLHMTQPAVSQHIRALEQDLDAYLIERTNRMVRLTRAGEIVHDHALRMVGIEDSMRRLVDDLSNTIGGPLRIGASYSIGEYMLPGILAEFCRVYPNVVPDIEIGNTQHIGSLVSSRQLDLGFVEGHYAGADVQTETLGEDTLILVGSQNHRLIETEVATASDIAEECWLVREEGSGTRSVTDNVLQQYQISPRRTMTFSSTQAIKEAARAGLGISVLSIWTVQTELSLGMLQPIHFSGMPIRRTLYVVTQSSGFQPKVVSAFAEFAQHYFDDIPKPEAHLLTGEVNTDKVDTGNEVISAAVNTDKVNSDKVDSDKVNTDKVNPE